MLIRCITVPPEFAYCSVYINYVSCSNQDPSEINKSGAGIPGSEKVVGAGENNLPRHDQS